MATSGRIQTQVVRRSSYFYMSWSATEQDVANNRTKIHWVVGLHTDAGQDYWYTNAVRINNAYLNGSQVSSGGTWSNITTGGDHDLQSGDIWVGHEADGTKSFDYSVSGWLYSYGDYGASGTSTLNTIPRASQPSCITYPNTTNDIGNMNSTITIHMNRNSSAFTHTVKYYFGNASGTIATGVVDNCSWKIPLSLANQVPNAVSGVGSIEVTTYNGSTKIGTKSVGFTVHVPSSVVPSFSSLGVTRVDGSVPSGWGIYVQGKSKATLTINGATGSYGSTIKTYAISGGGFSSASSSFTTGFLTTAGTITFTATITDSRGRTSSKTASISVVSYTAPSISKATAVRCNSGGTVIDDGTYAKVNCTYTYSNCNSKNTLTTKVEYKKVSDGSYTNAGTFSSGTDKTLGSGGINIDNSYNIKFTISDTFTSVSYEVLISTAFTTIDLRKGGKGIAIGKVAEEDNLVDANMNLKVRGSFNGMKYGTYLTENSSSGNQWHLIAKFEVDTNMRQATSIFVKILTGPGQNGESNQNTVIDMMLKRGWSGNFPKYFGCNYIAYGRNESQIIKVICRSQTDLEIWLYTPSSYSAAYVIALGNYISYSTNLKVQSETPSGGSEQSSSGKWL